MFEIDYVTIGYMLGDNKAFIKLGGLDTKVNVRLAINLIISLLGNETHSILNRSHIIIIYPFSKWRIGP